ncbi:hypothetical protein EVAR_51748_1 [Eumeta japonica]|uniref:Uncharacterized protein n=1 Tax=Eumeta variegata TaxID=151549 RepID=A0A4C1SIG8_EUMVA|nr:hypothetical protein EVAR_89576_1 [Eumeta japonica]GBP60983.1 hypothetical protein EVAR_51748_1 [Eumeta japonica]
MPRNEKRLNHKIKELKRILNNDRNVRFQAYLESLDPTAATDYSLWKATKKIKDQQLTPHLENRMAAGPAVTMKGLTHLLNT